MTGALEEHCRKVSTDNRTITKLRFADGVDALAHEEQKLEALAESLDKFCTGYKAEKIAEKTKLKTNIISVIQ